ncbi:arginine/alanine aminopeptidase PWA37_000413 [Arxiozyma heterogenica]|uniref:arginine/alanine aminopeptidase n=1 Tax=Arxiozyma heterogenica TaxID=278026 RepID=UPI002EF6B9A0
MSYEREVLPTNVTPVHYNLQFEPNFQDFTFIGSTSIQLRVNDSSIDSISVNTLELEYESVKLNDQIDNTGLEIDTDKQVAKFSFPKGTIGSLATSEDAMITLDIKFKGILNDQMAGFYRAKYMDPKSGETKYMATTQFEATDARRAFPCFDEPNLKATFSVTLVSETNYTHLSNMDVKEESVNETGKKVTVFNITPKMSTYLVAFIVAELAYVENTEFRIPVRVYATPGTECKGQYSADLAAQTLKFFEYTFNIDYPLPKMDMVAVHEFSAGAMENWGLVTYRVADVLIEPSEASLDRLQRVAEVVQHELAHQWFGNLVTMDWWESLWLNEGFATWMSWYSCNNTNPDWKVWEQYVADSLQRALSLDSLRSSHPIEVPVKNAAEINQIFDAISYSKGSSVLRMVSKWIGEHYFIKGVSEYLCKYQYDNAKTEDLWRYLSLVTGKDVTSVMNVWTKKVGFPVVRVDETEDGKITLTQNRFLSTGDVKPEDDEIIFPVLLSLKTSECVDESLIFNKRTETFEINKGDNDFFKINGDQIGTYITLYSDARWKKLGEQRELLSVEDRTGLVADVKSLAASGYTSTVNFLDLISHWREDESFVVWNQIINSITALQNTWIFEPSEINDALLRFVLDLVSKKVHELKWDFSDAGNNSNNNNDYTLQKLKVTLFGAACAAKDSEVLAAAKEMFNNQVSGKMSIPSVIKPIVFTAIAKNGSVQEYEILLNIYKNSSNTDEKLAALRSLGAFKDPALIERTLSYLLDGTVLKQDIYTPLVGLRTHPEGIKAMWKWAQENWDEIVSRLQPGSPVLGHVLTLTTSGYTSTEAADEIASFFASKDTRGYDQSLAQALDAIKAKAQWVKRDREVVSSYLKQNEYLK